MSRAEYDQYMHQQHLQQHPEHQQQQDPPRQRQPSDPYSHQTYSPYAQTPVSNNPYIANQSEADSEYYDPPGMVDPHGHRRPSGPMPAHQVDNPDIYASFPEEPNSYLLDRFDRRQNPYQQPSFEQMPEPSTPQMAMPMPTNFYQGYTGSHNFGVDDVDNFQPFPIHGDDYALNGWEMDQSDTDTLHDSSQHNLPMPSGTPRPTISPGPDSYSMGPGSMTPNGMPPPPVDFPEFGAPMPPSMMPPPDEQQRRGARTKNVRLYKGNLVLDCPVAKNFLHSFDPDSVKEREFTHMRYSAATCKPTDFAANRFTLRQMCFKQPRQIELLICVTIYNEDDLLLGRTLSGIFKNIKHLVMRQNTRSKTWGEDAWKKVAVCVIADGRKQINDRALALMARLGVYQDGLAKNTVADKSVKAHIYEYTTMCGIKSVDKVVNFTNKRTVPVQMIFCLKERNQKKINSHRWFFNAFGEILNPKVCVLLDAGTEPSHDSIYHLWKAFDDNPRIGGACGEIRAGLGKAGHKLLNPLVAAQNFEYKMSNILDKPMESVFGFITVLPGAFSAYRYVALQNNAFGEGPLEKYFKGEEPDPDDVAGKPKKPEGIFTANMYLAEDRILCFELVAKRDAAWLLKYVKSAHAVTDVPEKLSELILQRRRWLNGSFFAAIYSISHVYNLWRSSHSLLRKLILHVEFLYQFASILFSWFSIGNFFLVFRILTNSLGDDALGFRPGKILGIVFLWMYCACIVSIFVLSFGNRPKGTQTFYIVVVIFFAILMAYLLFAAIFISVKSISYTLCINDNKLSVSLVFGNALFRDLVVSLMSTYALYFVSSFLFFEPWHMFTSFLQYLLISPSYVNVLNVYAFCNIHDISWGTKGDDGKRTDLGKAELSSKLGELVMNVPSHLTDIDKMYQKQQELLEKPPKKDAHAVKSDAEQIKEEKDKTQDYYALFRSSVVLIWIFTNFIIIAVVLNTAGLSTITDKGSNGDETLVAMLSRRTIESSTAFIKEVTDLVTRQAAAPPAANSCGNIGDSGSFRTEIYLTVVLWCVAALAAFRFIGALVYLFFRLFGY